jgi:hypothetical protein
MNQTYVSLQFDKLSKRFEEVRLLLALAEKYQSNNDTYTSLCRSAHVLLVSNFEGLYKDICKDVIDDINASIHFYEIKKEIFNTYCGYFTKKGEETEFANTVKLRLKEALNIYPAKLKVEPFLFVDNKNPTPKIIETILSKFGVDNFFWNIADSDLDIVFKNQKSETKRLRDKLRVYTERNVATYPYTVTTDFYHPIKKTNQKITKTIWEDFLNDFLKGRHDIVHGHTTGNPVSHGTILDASIKMEILILAFIINLCSACNPVFILS